MRRLNGAVAIAMLWGLWATSAIFAPSAQAIDPIELEDPALQQRYRDLSHELRCMQCQNQSIADSPVGLAGDLRREVRELLLRGLTDDQVRDHLRVHLRGGLPCPRCGAMISQIGGREATSYCRSCQR